jgi:hypothetical protein
MKFSMITSVFFFEDVFVDIVMFLGVIYLCFFGVWNLVSISSFPSESCIKFF